MSTAAPALGDRFEIAGRAFHSRLIIGTGKYRTHEEMKAAHSASGAEMVTVAVRRVPLDRSSESFLDHLDPSLQMLPNTAGCYTAEEAIRTARLAREALNTEWIKLEVIGDQTTLFPDNEQTLEAARTLVKEGFVVLPYFTDDLIVAKKLLDAGCQAVMPLAAPIGSGLGVQNPTNLRIMREQLPDATIIVDAGVGTASDAAIAMELGADAVLMNTAIAEAQDSSMMARAMKLAIEAGRLAYLSGRMAKRLYASASSPVSGVVR
jgi:thiazole synthase